MSVGPLAVEIALVCCIVAVLLHRYGNWRKQHVLVTIAVFIAWYFSFLIVVILPLDVSSTCYRQCIKDHTPVILAVTTVAPPSNSTSGVINTTHHTDDQTVVRPNGSDRLSVVNVSGDLTPTTQFCKKPWSYVPPYILPTLWRIIYWTSQFLTWFLLPMMQSYAQAGDFSVAGKIKSSLIDNAIYYGSYLLIFGVCLIYVAVRPDLHVDGSQLKLLSIMASKTWVCAVVLYALPVDYSSQLKVLAITPSNISQLKVLAITASNTWGLFLLVLLLGYGLVDIPRSCWLGSRRGYMLQASYFKVAKLSTEKSESEENLEDILDDVKKAADTIRYNHPLRRCVDTILLKCPESVQNSVKRNMDDYEDYHNPTETPTEKSLVRLHKGVIRASQQYRRTQCQWANLIERTLEWEDIELNETSSNKRFLRSTNAYSGAFKRVYTPTVEWYWKCWVRPWGLRVLAVLLSVMAVMVVWSEVLFFVKEPILSVFALFVQLAKRNFSYFNIELACMVTLAFLCVCAYYTVFKVRVLNYYYLASHHMTNEYSLIFCGMMLCRLTPPLCLNFLGLIHLDSHITSEYNLEETSYTQIMGHMDVISFISDGFNIYFPIAILLLCTATYFRLGSHVLHFLGFEQFIGDDDMTQELTDEGRELVKRERRKRQRVEDMEERRRTWNERVGCRQPQSGSSAHPVPSFPEPNVSNEPSRRPGSAYSSAQSPEDNDRTELLRQAEPVDYTSDAVDVADDLGADLSLHAGSNAMRYQTRSGPFRAARPDAGRAAPPPRGIFDDI